MNWNHAAYSVDPRRFGRRPAQVVAKAQASPAISVSEDVKLFATTFAAGFLFVSLMIA